MPMTLHRKFTDRRDAGRRLAAELGHVTAEDPIVLGLARGGLPVAHEVADALGAALDVLVVCKVGAPGNPELGIGAVAEGGVRVVDRAAVAYLLMSEDELETAIARASAEVAARVERYRAGRAARPLQGRTVIVVDDGLATGGTARAALRAVRAQAPRRLVLAVPVGAPETVRSLQEEADEVVCTIEPRKMLAVGLWYEHFEPTTDEEITALLRGAAGDRPAEASDPPSTPGTTREVRIPSAGIVGDLILPDQARALVVFAHGSGSSRFSPRNRQVARALNDRGLGTLLLDLLTPEEERHRAKVFDIGLLSERLVAATRWIEAEAPQLAIGFFGASTGAGAALVAAAALGDEVGAVVSRGGRPDLAGAALPQVRAPVLLIVGGRDDVVIELNREAHGHLRALSELVIVPGATHLFEEPGALEYVARLAGDWFEYHLAPMHEPAA